MACAASKKSRKLLSAAIFVNAGMSHGRPQRCTPRIADVCSVTRDRTCCGSKVWVLMSTSQNTGVIPCHARACAVAMNVSDGKMTSPESSRTAHRHLQCGGRIAGGNAVLDPQQLGNILLELLHVGSVVRQHATIENIEEPLCQAIAVADIRPADVQRIVKRRLAATNGQIVNGPFQGHAGDLADWCGRDPIWFRQAGRNLTVLAGCVNLEFNDS